MRRSIWPPRWCGGCGCDDERPDLGGGRADRRGRLGRAVPGRRRHFLGGRPRLTVRHHGCQHLRRGDPGPADRARSRPRRSTAGGHGGRRLVHDVLDLDAGNAAADRGAPVPHGGSQCGRQPRARSRRRGSRPPDRSAAVNQDSFKLTSYFGERHRTDGGFAADALLDLYGRHEIATSILLRGAEGFGARHRLRTDRSLTLSEDLPLIAVAVDSRPRIKEVLEPTARFLGPGLVTLERARLLSGDVETLSLRDEVHEETKLTIYLGRQERVYRVPAFVAVCDLLHRRGVAGATAMLGVDGTAHGRRERAAFFSRNAATPMMIIAVGAGPRIARVLPELGGLLTRPLLTLERVRICKRDGELLCAPPLPALAARPATDDSGLPVWHK